MKSILSTVTSLYSTPLIQVPQSRLSRFHVINQILQVSSGNWYHPEMIQPNAHRKQPLEPTSLTNSRNFNKSLDTTRTNRIELKDYDQKKRIKGQERIEMDVDV